MESPNLLRGNEFIKLQKKPKELGVCEVEKIKLKFKTINIINKDDFQFKQPFHFRAEKDAKGTEAKT